MRCGSEKSIFHDLSRGKSHKIEIFVDSNEDLSSKTRTAGARTLYF